MAGLQLLTPFALAALGVSYLVYVGIYRLFLSPISRFPGPKLAALTFWYEGYYDAVKGGQYIHKIKQLHAKYGPIIRINPLELHVNDPEFYEAIYSREGRSDKFAYYCRQFGPPSSEVLTIPHDLHRMRRASVNPFFSKQKVGSLEDTVLRRHVSKLCERLDKAFESGEQVPIRLAYESLSTDIITDYVMSTSYMCLDDPSFNPKYHEMITTLGSILNFTKHAPWIMEIMQFLPARWVTSISPGMGLILDFQEDCAAQSKKIRDGAEAEKKSHPTVFHGILSSPDLPESEKSAARMRMEGAQFVSAGTDTVSNTLSVMSWHIFNSPDILHRLRLELRTVQPDPASPARLRELETLPYLTACIQEGLRLGFGLANRSARSAPDRTIQYKDWVIPCGTPVSMTSVLMHLDPAIWPEPERFDPERWTKPEDFRRLSRYMVAFSRGTRVCLGINLAMAELYLITATLFGRYDFRYAPDITYEDHVRFHADMYFPHPKRDGGEMKVIIERTL